jgi:hypothetical protein
MREKRVKELDIDCMSVAERTLSRSEQFCCQVLSSHVVYALDEVVSCSIMNLHAHGDELIDQLVSGSIRLDTVSNCQCFESAVVAQSLETLPFHRPPTGQQHLLKPDTEFPSLCETYHCHCQGAAYTAYTTKSWATTMMHPSTLRECVP